MRPIKLSTIAILRCLKDGLEPTRVSEKYKVTVRTVYNINHRYRYKKFRPSRVLFKCGGCSNLTEDVKLDELLNGYKCPSCGKHVL